MLEKPTTLVETLRARMTLWALCLNCGKAGLVDPQRLFKAPEKDEPLDAVAAELACSHCKSKLTQLVPTPRSMMYFASRAEEL